MNKITGNGLEKRLNIVPNFQRINKRFFYVLYVKYYNSFQAGSNVASCSYLTSGSNNKTEPKMLCLAHSQMKRV